MFKLASNITITTQKEESITKKELALRCNFMNAKSFCHLKERLSMDTEFLKEIHLLRNDNHFFGYHNRFKKIVPRDEVELIEKYIGIKILKG